MKKLSERMKDGFILAVIAAFCGGSTPVVGKYALTALHPFTVTTFRFLFASLFLIWFVYKSKELKLSLFGQLKGVAFLGALNPILFFIALQFTQASVTPLIYACVPALTALYLYFTLHQKPTTKQLQGIIIGFIGVATIILLPVLQRGTPLSALSGNLIIFVAAIAFMFYGIYSKKAQQKLSVSPIAVTFYFAVMSLIVSVPLTVWELSRYGLPVGLNVGHVLSVLFIGIVGTGVSYVAYQYALKLGSEVSAGLFMYLQPIFTLSMAAIFLNEKITVPFLIGGVMAIVGARLASSKKIVKI